MKSPLIALIIGLMIILLVSCSGSKEVEVIPLEERYKKAKALYDDEKYLEAIEDFKVITMQYQGSEYTDDAQFYLAESRFHRGEFILAGAEYDNLLRTMATSPFAPLSRYKKGLSYYKLSPKPQLDQKYTRMALDEFQSFLDYFPTDTLSKDVESKIQELSSKIAFKVLESGILYYRMELYKAAIAYFANLIEQYNDSPYADDAFLWKSKSLYARREYDEALTSLTVLKEKYPSSELMPDAEKLQRDIEYDKSHPDQTLWNKLGFK